MSRTRRSTEITDPAGLDEADRQLLRVLQADGRIRNLDLAARCNLSASSCSQRLQRLRDQGYITGFTAILDPSRVGRSLLIFVEIVLDRKTSDDFQAFAAAARRAPEVLECHRIVGRFDCLIKARVKDMAACGVFLNRVLDDMPGVRETRTYAALEEVKSTTELPI